MSQTHEFYRKDIDGLRALAIIAVVSYHVGLPGATGGFVGVDVFFVLSGYLITSLLVAEAVTHGRVSLSSFYARRIRRLFPALCVVVVATTIVGAFVLVPISRQQHELYHSAIATAVYVSNVYFRLNPSGYFDASASLKPLLHTWSLSVEEQFYMGWPLIVAAVLWATRYRRVSLQPMLLIATAVIFCSSLAYGIHLSHQSPGAAFYLLPSRAWELSTGAAMALLLPRIRAPLPVLGGVLSALGLLAIVAAITSLTEDMAYSGLVGALPVFGTALVVAGGSLSARNPVQLALSARPMVLIGLLSYSWYLWHWPVLALTRAYTLETANLATNLSCAGFALVLACASYRFVERPIRLSRPGAFARTGTTLAMGAAISLLMCLPAVTLDLWATNIADREPQYARLRAALVDRPPLRRFCHQKKPFVGLAPDSKCTVGDSRYSTVLVLWGDSHADHLSPLMERFAALSPMTPVLVHTFSACPPIASSVAGDPANTLACTQFNDAVLEEIARLRRKGLRGVVLAAKWARDFEDPQPEGGAGDADNPTGHQTSRNAESLALRVDGLTSLGMRVLLIAPSPHLPFRVPDCLARRSSRECSAARKLVDRQREESMRVLLAIQAGNPNVRVLDFNDYLCTADACPPTKDGKVLYLDDNHLTATASRALLPSAIAALDWVSDPRAEGTAVNADTAALLLTKTFLRR